MKNKRIYFTAPNIAELLEKDTDEPKAGQVLVELAVSTISSGTERANLVGEVNISIHDNNTEAVFPRISGYSSAGTVVSVGEGVKSVKAGDRVALSWSTHSKYVCTPEINVHKIPFDDVSFSSAALCHISTFPMAAIRKCRLEVGESAIVMGVGVLGMIAIKQLRIGGAVPVIAADPVPEKRELALKIGADYAFDPSAPDFAEKVKSVTDGGVNVAIEVTGNGKALDEVLDCMKQYGRVALLGCTRNSDFTIDYYHKVHGKGVSLIGAHTAARPVHDTSSGLWTTHDDVMTAMRLIHLGRLNLEELVAEVHSPSDAPEVYKRLATEPSFPVVQFDWTKISVEE